MLSSEQAEHCPLSNRRGKVSIAVTGLSKPSEPGTESLAELRDFAPTTMNSI